MVFSDDLDVGSDRHAFSIDELYEAIEDALAIGFPSGQEFWVQGEIQKLTVVRGHCYIDLVDPTDRGAKGAPQLSVKCWQTRWNAVCRTLAGEGLVLEAGMTVLLRGSIDVYRPRGQLSFIATEVDVTALLGRLAAERAALVASLRAAGIVDANRARALPPAPLSIGLVASPSTEGCSDFLGQLRASRFAFLVSLVPTVVQGAQAPAAVEAAIDALSAHGVDVVVLVRGGGSKADLACFDDERIARAIGRCAVPVWTGIGHTGDESIADLCAHTASITPTACGRALVQVVETFAEGISASAARIGERARWILEGHEANSTLVRSRLVGVARAELRTRSTGLAAIAGQLARRSATVLDDHRRGLEGRTARLVQLAPSACVDAAGRLKATRRLLDAYDPIRLLERGYSLTYDHSGALVRNAQDVQPGDALLTRLASGMVTSTVSETSTEQGAL